MRCGEPTGDAELKMDWTEPPTELNAMGIDSYFWIFRAAQADAQSGCRDVLGLS